MRGEVVQRHLLPVERNPRAGIVAALLLEYHRVHQRVEHLMDTVHRAIG